MMDALLTEIESQFVSLVPETLAEAEFESKLYAAFIPYFGWEMYADEQAEANREIFLLTEEYYEQCELQHPNPGKLGYHTYCWGEFINHCGITQIQSESLQANLLKWYEYQIDNDDCSRNANYLRMIGGTHANACQTLNKKEWDSRRFTEDFVVFTDCMADEAREYCIKQSTSAAWLEQQKSNGIFQTYYTVD